MGLLPNHGHCSTKGAYTRGMDEVRQEAPQAELPTKEQVLEALKVVYDPEIPVNIVDLGLSTTWRSTRTAWWTSP